MTERWSEKAAQRWWQRRRWVCGFNFLPSSAVNFLELWHPDTYDRATIERELGWAASLGFNALRVNLHVLVWRHDRDGLLERLDGLIGVAARLGLDTVPCFFDDCGFGGAEPVYGPQPAPIGGVHNSRAVACPGRAALLQRERWPEYEAYVRDVTRAFRDDARVLFWDLYNEPGNAMIFAPGGARTDPTGFASHSVELMRQAFDWCRAERPEQPLTVGAWTTPEAGTDAPPYDTAADRLALSLSDILSFHAYRGTREVSDYIAGLSRLGRPLFCTEWMARGVGSRIDDQLPLFREAGVGCFQWGLVRGRTQTHLPWPEELVRAHGGTAERGTWFHDLLDVGGEPYDPQEVEVLRAALGDV